jgi:hypothetical protein
VDPPVFSELEEGQQEHNGFVRTVFAVVGAITIVMSGIDAVLAVECSQCHHRYHVLSLGNTTVKGHWVVCPSSGFCSGSGAVCQG